MQKDGDINDPAFDKQWHLFNVGQRGARVDQDINVKQAWNHGFTGKGVVVAVLDSGVDWHHPDLLPNYFSDGSWDFTDGDADPSPSDDHDDGKNGRYHGTRVAGEVAAVRGNGVCGVGVAYEARWSGIRLIGRDISDEQEAMALMYRIDINDIFTCSWGPSDDGATLEGPGPKTELALHFGIVNGRRALGTVYVFASGNGGAYDDNCNSDGYANSPFTLTIGAVNSNGKKPAYAEHCAAMLASTYSGDSKFSLPDITTTDSNGMCTDNHLGTSAAAPLAAGMIALMLEARSELSWRDISHIIVHTAVMTDPKNNGWAINDAGFHISHEYGFGRLDAWALVRTAQVWTLLSAPQLIWKSPRLNILRHIPKMSGDNDASEPLFSDFEITRNLLPSDMATLEYVSAFVTIKHRQRGVLEVILISPAGTESRLATPRRHDMSSVGYVDWRFSTSLCWGETPEGRWRLAIREMSETTFQEAGLLVAWTLELRGAAKHCSKVLVNNKMLWTCGHMPSKISIKPIATFESTLNSSVNIFVSDGASLDNSGTDPLNNFTYSINDHAMNIIGMVTIVILLVFLGIFNQKRLSILKLYF